MIDEKAFTAARSAYWECNPDRLKAAIEAYLAAAPLPGGGEPVMWTNQQTIDAFKNDDTASVSLAPVWRDWLTIPLYTAAPDTAQAVAVATEPLVRLIQIMLDNNPCDQISDAGHSVIDLWRQEAQASIRALSDGGQKND